MNISCIHILTPHPHPQDIIYSKKPMALHPGLREIDSSRPVPQVIVNSPLHNWTNSINKGKH